MTYRIRSIRERDEDTGNPLYWSDEMGWVDRASADTMDLGPSYWTLPMGGEWERDDTAIPSKRANP
jgi:hypothetical protein